MVQLWLAGEVLSVAAARSGDTVSARIVTIVCRVCLLVTGGASARKCVVLLVLIVAGFPPGACAAMNGGILVLYANRPDLPAVKMFDASFRSTISGANPKGVEIYTEYLDQDRFASEKHVHAYVDLM